ncbi:hypothetical protein [Rugosimonospora africana]|uniref:Uncharacterized protein n=1 Tax=Rugosimonospora africana TaxID=556532 RepID=A0A8J3VQV9_9ACTN|nr:hypothetical protein [Rugosimonospora africana]GIH15535.1 hypothetical protein Raf01_37070 [Rugosimonospora africana]
MSPRPGTLLTKIKDHNRYNGFLFSAVEFGVIAAVTAGLGVYFVVAHRWVPALVAIGLAVNCTPVAVLALRSRARHEPQIGYAGLASAETRRQIRAERPHLLRDTLTITGLTLIPYAAALRLLVERGRGAVTPGAGAREDA